MKHEPKTLFRPEVQEAKALAWVGEPFLPASLPMQFGAAITAILFCAIAGFVIFGQYTRSVSVDGVMLPPSGVTKIAAPAGGWVSGQTVQDGDLVRRGQMLYTLRIDSTTAHGGTEASVIMLLKSRKAEVEGELSRQSDLEAAKKQSLNDQLSSLQSEQKQAEAEIALVADNVSSLRSMTDEQKRIVSKGLSTVYNYQSLLQSYMSKAEQLQQMRRDQVQLTGKISDIGNQLRSLGLDSQSQTSSLRQKLIDVEQQIAESEARREITITAPRSGIVTAITARTGQTIAAGSPMLAIVPSDEPLEAQLFAASSAIGFVRPGTRVLLRYDAFPYQKFGQYGGTVVRISRTTLSPAEIDQYGIPAQSNERTPLYQIAVQPDANNLTAWGGSGMQPGMTLQANIQAERRRIYQWILEPLFSLASPIADDKEVIQ